MKPNDTITALPHKCLGGRNHRWQFTGVALPTCYDCHKTGPEVAELTRQHRNKPRICPLVMFAQHYIEEYELTFKGEYDETPLGQLYNEAKAALALARREKGKP